MAVKENFDLTKYTDIKTSMYIEASAGTGKTFTITELSQDSLGKTFRLIRF